MKGKLYGIGVGPGDPELLTLKAKRLIEECDIVAVPVKKEGEDSVALNIAKGAVEIPEAKIQEIVFTMAKDKTKREVCRQAASEEIMKMLDEGKSIAMLALGDIGIYSTYAYVHKHEEISKLFLCIFRNELHPIAKIRLNLLFTYNNIMQNLLETANFVLIKIQKISFYLSFWDCLSVYLSLQYF